MIYVFLEKLYITEHLHVILVSDFCSSCHVFFSRCEKVEFFVEINTIVPKRFIQVFSVAIKSLKVSSLLVKKTSAFRQTVAEIFKLKKKELQILNYNH